MAVRTDPYRQTRFLLEIEGLVTAGFSYCDLPTATSSVVEYREGNDPPTPRKLVGLHDYGPLVLELGVTDQSAELSEWRQFVEQGKMEEARRPIAVTLLDTAGNPGARWELRDAWPSQYDAPRLDATTSEVAIERLVVVHEGFARVSLAREDDSGSQSDTAVRLSRTEFPLGVGDVQGIEEPTLKEPWSTPEESEET